MSRLTTRIGLVVALLAASAVGPQAFAATNLLANPGFEDGGGTYNGWTTFGSGVQLSTPTTDNIYRSGTTAAKIYGEFTGCPGLIGYKVGGFFQSFTPVAGKVYQFSGYSFVSHNDLMLGTDTCNNNRLIAKVVFYDAAVNGNEIASNEVVVGDGNTVPDEWHRFTVSAPVPAGALRVQAMFLFLQPACDPGAVFVDDTWFEQVDPVPGANLLANPAFSSGLASWSTFGNVVIEGRSFGLRSTPASAKLYSSFVADTPSGMYQSFAASAGQTWELGGYALDTCVENPIDLDNDNLLLGRIVFRDAGSNEVGGNDVTMVDATSPLGTWTRHSVTAVAPAGTVTAEAYVLFVSPTLMGGAAWVDDLYFRNLNTVDVTPAAPAPALALAQSAPNPFVSSTRIDFALPRADRVDLAVFDLAGRRIATLAAGPFGAGPHSVTWNGRLDSGAQAAPGLYPYVLRTSGGRVTRTLLRVR